MIYEQETYLNIFKLDFKMVLNYKLYCTKFMIEQFLVSK